MLMMIVLALISILNVYSWVFDINQIDDEADDDGIDDDEEDHLHLLLDGLHGDEEDEEEWVSDRAQLTSPKVTWAPITPTCATIGVWPFQGFAVPISAYIVYYIGMGGGKHFT